jgi:hypothetical protein
MKSMKLKKKHGINIQPEIGPRPKQKDKNIILKTIEAAVREAAVREAAVREAATIEAAVREAAVREAATIEAEAREAAAREAAAREAATIEAEAREAAAREAAAREAAAREAAAREAAAREAAAFIATPEFRDEQRQVQAEEEDEDEEEEEEEDQLDHPGVNGAIGTSEVLTALQGTGTKLPNYIKKLKEKLEGSTILTELSRSTDIDFLAVAMKFLEQYPESAGKIVNRMENYAVLNRKTRPHESSPSVESLWDGYILVEIILQDKTDNYHSIWPVIEPTLNAYISDVCNPIKKGVIEILYNYIIGNCKVQMCDTTMYDPLYSYNQQTIGNCGFISHTRLIIELIQLLYTCLTGKILGNIQIPNSNCFKIFTVNNILIMLSLEHGKQHVFLFYIMEDYFSSVESIIEGITKPQLYIYIYVHFYLFMFIMCYLEDSLLGTSEKMACDFTVKGLCIPGNFKVFSDRGTSYDTINIFNTSIMELFSGIDLPAKITSRVGINQQSPLKGIPNVTIGFIGILMNCISTAATLITFRTYDFWNTPCSIDGWDKTQSVTTTIPSVKFGHSESATKFLGDIHYHMSISKYGRIYAGISIQLNKLAEHIENGTAQHLTQEIIDIMFKSIASPSIAKSPHASHAMFILFYKDSKGNTVIFLRNSWDDCSTSIPITLYFIEWAIQEKIIFEVYYFTLNCNGIKLMGGKKTKKIRHNKKRSNRRIKKRSNRRIKKRSNMRIKKRSNKKNR